MTEFKHQFTEAIITVMKSWGWRFLGLNHARDTQWSKYEKGILVATFGDKTWNRDFANARLATLRKGEVMLASHEKLSKPIIDLLESMGWEWLITCHDAWEWLKFNRDGTCLAKQGDECWIADVEKVKLIASEDFSPEVLASIPRCYADEGWNSKKEEPVVWERTMELRFQSQWPKAKPASLQQKWVRISGGPACGGGSTEWRDVEYGNAQGLPF